jgi:hypothetical protein
VENVFGPMQFRLIQVSLYIYIRFLLFFFFFFLFSGFASCCAQYKKTQPSTTFHNQTPECSPFHYYYTALHVSAYRQAIIRCYLTINIYIYIYKGQVTEYILCGSTESRYTVENVIYKVYNTLTCVKVHSKIPIKSNQTEKVKKLKMLLLKMQTTVTEQLCVRSVGVFSCVTLFIYIPLL